MQLVSGSGVGLAPALCEAVQALLACLREQVSLAATTDPLGGLPQPRRCHSLLQLLLEVAWKVGGVVARSGGRSAAPGADAAAMETLCAAGFLQLGRSGVLH